MIREIFIEVFDDRVKKYPVIRRVIGDVAVYFVYSDTIRKRMDFSGALFVDEYAFSNAVYRYPRSRRACFLQESPIKEFALQADELLSRFDTVFTYDRELLTRSPAFHEVYYGTSWINDGHPCRAAQFKKTDLCSFVGSVAHPSEHGYSLRKKVADLLQQDERVDCWGRGIREFDSKDDVTGKYKFCVVMENCQRDWYFTEKLIDCFVTDTVPVYWGCPSIGKLFNEEGMLVFNTVDELKTILDGVSDETYEAALSAIAENRERAVRMKLTSHADLLGRIAERMIDCDSAMIRPGCSVSVFERAKGFAGIRLLREKGLKRPCA